MMSPISQMRQTEMETDGPRSSTQPVGSWPALQASSLSCRSLLLMLFPLWTNLREAQKSLRNGAYEVAKAGFAATCMDLEIVISKLSHWVKWVRQGKTDTIQYHLGRLLFSHSVVSDFFVTPWTVAHQASLSMGFLGQEYWSGLPFPSPGALPNSGIKPTSASLLHGQADSLLLTPQGSLWYHLHA